MILTLLSLLACLITVTLWATSYAGDQTEPPLQERWTLQSTRGQFVLQRLYPAPPVAAAREHDIDTDVIVFNTIETGHSNFAFGWQKSTVICENRLPPLTFYRLFTVQHWFIAAITAVLPAYAAVRRIWSKRFALGHCRKCGYDLRATPDRCPECDALATPLNAARKRAG
jgi:hypothetical protein